MPFITVTAGYPFTIFGTMSDIYWLPPGMEFGGSRLATGYLVDAPAPVGAGGCEFGIGVQRLPVPDSLINSTLPANTPTVSYSSWRGPFFGYLQNIISSTGAHQVNRPFRYGPRTRRPDAPDNIRFASALDAQLTPYVAAQWPGALASLTAQTLIFTSPDMLTFSTTGSEAYPVHGLVVRVDTDIASGLKIGYAVSWGGDSPGQMTDIDAIYGSRGSTLARLRAMVPAGASSVACHQWRCITGWEDSTGITRIWAPILAADRQCSDFAFDVDFAAPVGNQRVIYSCETPALRDAGGTGVLGGLYAFPILTRRSIPGSAPSSGYARTNSQRPGSVGYSRDYTWVTTPISQWRDAGGAAGWRNCVIIRGQWDADPWFGIGQHRPIPAFHELDQAVAIGVAVYAGAQATDYEIAWGYLDYASGVAVPITTPVAISIGVAPTANVATSIAAPASIPSIPGMRYSLISRRKVSPASSFDAWDILYSSKNVGGAMNFMNGAMCLPRVYKFDVRKQVLLPSSADAVPVAHYGWSIGDYAMRPSAQPVPSGSWTCVYVPAASSPWQVNAMVTGISGAPSYGTAWAWTPGYRWRVQLPQWDGGRPYVAPSRMVSGAAVSSDTWYKPSPTVTTADFVLWRMATSQVACGDDIMQRQPSADLEPTAYHWATYEWRQTISV